MSGAKNPKRSGAPSLTSRTHPHLETVGAVNGAKVGRGARLPCRRTDTEGTRAMLRRLARLLRENERL